MTKYKDSVKYIMIGGFLGAGKTTSIIRLAQHLNGQGFKVGLITNDQGHDLVDTANIRSYGFQVEEIPGGCFCCRFNSLVEASENLTRSTRPDIFLAEPVGSCTDLVATVSYPLRRIYEGRIEVSPLSVVLDPHRVERILGLEQGRQFSPKVSYIYLKQMEEADLLVINKSDLLDLDRMERLVDELEKRYPGKRVLTASAREGTGLDKWFDVIENAKPAIGPTMDVDYATYAQGEALLGWLNATINCHADLPLNGDRFLEVFAEFIQKELNKQDIEIAHLKMTLEPDVNITGEIAVLSVVSNQFCPELSLCLNDPIEKAQLVLNLRAEGDPAALEQILSSTIEYLVNTLPDLHLELDHLEAFRPGEPVPVYRMAHGNDPLPRKT